MKKLLLTLVLCTVTCFRMLSKDIVAVRKIFYAASENSSKTESLLSCIDGMGNAGSPIVRGYRGMYYMLKARYSYNPLNKLLSFKKGRKLLDDAIVSDPRNVELRFLRLSVQMNAPGFLDYSDNIEQDKKTIVSLYPTIVDEDLRERIRNFMAGIKTHLG